MHQQAELVTQLLLGCGRDLLVGCCVQATSRHLGGEPVRLGEPECEGDEELFDLLRRELLADLVERLDGLAINGQQKQPGQDYHTDAAVAD